jgi:hypothetical protein
MIIALLMVCCLHELSISQDKPSVSPECVSSTLDWFRGQVGDTITVNNVDSLFSREEVDDIGYQPPHGVEPALFYDTVYWHVPIVEHTADTVVLPSGCTQHLMIRLMQLCVGGDGRTFDFVVDFVDTSKHVVQPLIILRGDEVSSISERIIYDRASRSYTHIRNEYDGDSLVKRIEERMFK